MVAPSIPLSWSSLPHPSSSLCLAVGYILSYDCALCAETHLPSLIPQYSFYYPLYPTSLCGYLWYLTKLFSCNAQFGMLAPPHGTYPDKILPSPSDPLSPSAVSSSHPSLLPLPPELSTSPPPPPVHLPSPMSLASLGSPPPACPLSALAPSVASPPLVLPYPPAPGLHPAPVGNDLALPGAGPSPTVCPRVVG